MKYFKNTELAKLYNVSEKSVRNWIEAAQSGKLDLQLFNNNGKPYIANTSKNTYSIEKLVEKGKKFKNSRGLKAIVPTEDFYKTYNKKQIIDIISNLTIHKEIPLQYGYLDGGAESWDQYANRLVREESPNILNRTTGLIDLEAEYVNRLLGDRKVNVIDLGPGNGLPIRPTLTRLLKQGRLNRYIAIDISQPMLTILKKNIQTWFGDKVKLECYTRNFAEERFDDLFAEERLGGSDDAPVNLVFLLGGTLSNFRVPDHLLRVINNSLGPRDLFFYGCYLDTPYTRRYFDFSGAAYSQKDPQQSGLIPSLLEIDESLCDFELSFNERIHSRLKLMKPKVDLLINFELDGKICPVELRKNEPILLWRHKHYSYIDIINLLDKNDFDPLQATKSESQDHMLLISRIRTGLEG